MCLLKDAQSVQPAQPQNICALSDQLGSHTKPSRGKQAREAKRWRSIVCIKANAELNFMGYFCFLAKLQRPTANNRVRVLQERKGHPGSLTMANAVLQTGSSTSSLCKEIYGNTTYCLHMFIPQTLQQQPFLLRLFSKIKKYKKLWWGFPSQSSEFEVQNKHGIIDSVTKMLPERFQRHTSGLALLPLTSVQTFTTDFRQCWPT